MKVTAVIPVLNEEWSIERCVKSAWEANCDEVIVVDGGSSDRSPEIAAALQCRLIQAERGRARQQNAGARLAQGDLLLFLHSDSWLAPGACDQIRRTAGTKGRICGAFRQRIDATGISFRTIEFGNALRVRWLGLPYGDQGIFVERETFFELGGFPEIPLLEDLVFMRRLRKLARPQLLAGPIHTSARRWLRYGVVRQTLRNWTLLAGYFLGASPERLAGFYAPHHRNP